MIQPVILEKLAELPESLQTEVLHYIEFLIDKQAKNSTQEKPTKRGGLGIWKGKIWMSDDFDEPLEDLKVRQDAYPTIIIGYLYLTQEQGEVLRWATSAKGKFVFGI